VVAAIAELASHALGDCRSALTAANDRYLLALASVENITSLGELTARLCRPTALLTVSSVSTRQLTKLAA
jgi:hypothetical protein